MTGPAPTAPDRSTDGPVVVAAAVPAPSTQAATPTPAVAPTLPAAPEPVATQLVRPSPRCVTTSDGSYRLSLQLHPAELGAVHVDVQLHAGEVSLHLQAEHAPSAQALLAAPPGPAAPAGVHRGPRR